MQRSNAEKLTLELTLSGPEDVAIDLHQQKNDVKGSHFDRRAKVGELAQKWKCS